MKRCFAVIVCLLLSVAGISQKEIKLKKKDRKRDVELVTSYGTMVIRLSDSTPLHRDNFLKLVKQKYYDSILFHRVINRFMIQAGDPDSKRAAAGVPLGEGSPGYTIPAEFRTSLFHKKGAIAAARQSDDANPQKASSGSQFYIVQGRTFTDGAMDTLERVRLQGRKIPPAQREVYKTIGGTPFLDQNYTVFGEVISGMEVIDKIAVVPTSRGADRDRPVENVVILKAKLIKRIRNKK
jgi:cyclophilin family peptidyl-prolyl cis-trans isomerase